METYVTQTEDDFYMLILDDTETPTSQHDTSCTCAWCLAEQGITPDSADSHGICSTHSAMVYQAYQDRKAARA